MRFSDLTSKIGLKLKKTVPIKGRFFIYVVFRIIQQFCAQSPEQDCAKTQILRNHVADESAFEHLSINV